MVIKKREKKLSSYETRYKILKEIVWHLEQMNGEDLTSLAIYSNVSRPTLVNWMQSKVIAPRLDTLTKVAEQLGYEIVLQSINQPNLRKIKDM